jgi:hypothetical protein
VSELERIWGDTPRTPADWKTRTNGLLKTAFAELEEQAAFPVPGLRSSWTARGLLEHEFPEQRYAVPGLISEGLNLLVGAPKLGKSWLAMNVAAAVAFGGVALDKINVTRGEALYLALEDPPRRLQRRLRLVLSGRRRPKGSSSRPPGRVCLRAAAIPWTNGLFSTPTAGSSLSTCSPRCAGLPVTGTSTATRRITRLWQASRSSPTSTPSPYWSFTTRARHRPMTSRCRLGDARARWRSRRCSRPVPFARECGRKAPDHRPRR